MTSKITSETKLLQASLTGSREAFGTIVKRYQSLICGITYSATGDLGKSEELAQEAFIRAWKKLRQLKDFGSFRAWLCTITRNLVSKSIKEKQRDIVGYARPLEDMGQFRSAEPGPVETAISKEQEALVWGALKEIPEAYREPMVLFYREQQSVRQVAAEIGLSEDVAKQRLSRARKLLRAEVASLVEDVIGRTGPGKVFTVAVVAALPALTAQTASAAVAGAAAKSAAGPKAAGIMVYLGALLGPLLGFWGLIIGIKASIADAKSARERKFIKRALLKSVLYYLGGVTVIFVLGWLLNRHRLEMWPIIPLFVVFILALLVWAFWNRRRLKQIRKEEGTYVQDEYEILEMSRGSIYGAYAGSIMGAFWWLYMTAYSARDWTVLWAVVTAAVVIFLVATKLCLRARRQVYRIGMGVFVLAGLINLLVVNLRWESWKSVLKYHHAVTLRQMNLIIGAVIAGMVVWALILDFRLQKMKKKEHRD